MRIILFCLFMVLNLIPISASGTPEMRKNKKIPTIKLAYSWGQGFNNSVAAYTEKIKDIFILESEQNIGLDHKEKILIDAASNDLPDVFFFWSYEANLAYFARNGYIIEIDEYLKESTKNKKSDFYDYALEATKIDGKNYALPMEIFFGFWAINKYIFAKYELPIPKTWEDIKRIAPVLLRNGITPLSMGSFRGDPGHLFFSALTYQEPNGYRDTKRIKSTNNFIYPGTEQATQAVLDLISFGAIPKDTIFSGSWDNQIRSYNQEETAMIYSFSWVLALFDEEIARKSIIIPVPKINSQAIDPAGFTVGGVAQNICINAESWKDPAKKKAIIELVDWLSSDDVFILRFNQTGTLPAKKMELPELENPIYKKVIQFISNQEIYGIHEFFFKSLNAFDTYKKANDLLWGGALTKKEFLDMVQEGMRMDK